jgi:hypothetical protein
MMMMMIIIIIIIITINVKNNIGNEQVLFLRVIMNVLFLKYFI